MDSFYRTILKKAWKILWDLKFLWFFGLFASLSYNGEEYDVLVSNSNTISNLQDRLLEYRNLFSEGLLTLSWGNVKNYFAEHFFGSVTTAVAAIIILALAIFLIIVAQAALIYSAAQKEKNKESDFLNSFSLGTKKFKAVFVVNLITKLIVYGSLLIFAIPLGISFIRNGNLASLITLSIITFIFLVPINIIVSFIAKYASAYIVIENKNAGESISAGWRLFIKNWLLSLEMALILFAINFAISFVVAGLLTLTGLPFTGYLGFTIFTLILVLIGTWLAVFQYSSWTLVFMRLTEGRGIAKLLRWFSKKPEAA